MLQPTRTKYRKAHKGRIHGYASRGEILNYGAYGLKAIQPERIISKQIEADSTSIVDTSFEKKNGFTDETLLSMYLPNSYNFYWNTAFFYSC